MNKLAGSVTDAGTHAARAPGSVLEQLWQRHQGGV